MVALHNPDPFCLAGCCCGGSDNDDSVPWTPFCAAFTQISFFLSFVRSFNISFWDASVNVPDSPTLARDAILLRAMPGQAQDSGAHIVNEGCGGKAAIYFRQLTISAKWFLFGEMRSRPL